MARYKISKPFFAKLKSNKPLSNKLVLFAIAFALIGVAALFISNAAEDNSFIDLDTSAISGNAVVITDANAAGGKAVQFNDVVTPPPTTPTEALPFDMPTTASMRSSSKKVYAHYFIPFIRSINNANPDRYDTDFMPYSPAATKDPVYAFAGSRLRNRPEYRNPLPAVGGDSFAYLMEDMRVEVRQAIAAGLDGFTMDITHLDPARFEYERQERVIKAADEVDSGFKITLMPDMYILYQLSGRVLTPTQLADAMADLVGNHPSINRLPDGRVVIAPFNAEQYSPSQYSEFMNVMKNKHGINVALVPCFNSMANASSYASISYGFSHWGPRDPYDRLKQDAANLRNNAQSVTTGKIWMQPVAMQDVRITRNGSQMTYFEAKNTTTLRTMWEAAQEGANWVQIPTWNDYSESSEVAPSRNLSYNALDLISYELVKFKTGAYPALKRDTIYISHRIQPASARGSAHPNQYFPHVSSHLPAQDTVEVTTFLPTAANMTVRIGSDTHTYIANAGRDIRTFPLRTGQISATAARNGQTVQSVTSKWIVNASPAYAEMNYYLVGSRRSQSITPK